MYAIFTYIWLIFMVNVGKYSIHVSSGVGKGDSETLEFIILCQTSLSGLWELIEKITLCNNEEELKPLVGSFQYMFL